MWIASCETVYRLCPIRPERATPLPPRLVSPRVARGPATGDHVFASESEFPDDDWIIDETNTYAQYNLTSRIPLATPPPRRTTGWRCAERSRAYSSISVSRPVSRGRSLTNRRLLRTMGFNWIVCYANYDVKTQVILAKDFIIKSRWVRYLLIFLFNSFYFVE